jgi:energy-coupling factor transport system substrate-specific component
MPMRNTSNLHTKDIARLGLMIAVLEVSKLALANLPNIEIVSFWVILFTLTFGLRTIYAIYGFILIEGILYGVHFWWVAYLYVWTILALVTWAFRKQQSVLFWCILSALFGLFFGALCAIPYFITGTLSGGLYNGLLAGFSWWIAGIPYDFLHCIGNFFTMLILYKPLRNTMQRL